jgi:hypothetical protein
MRTEIIKLPPESKSKTQRKACDSNFIICKMIILLKNYLVEIFVLLIFTTIVAILVILM